MERSPSRALADHEAPTMVMDALLAPEADGAPGSEK
jgi:hypothetical protein